ncbi:hypothetical protein BCR33DRAFT_725329 [Rhizoclosmatium globosum]|uniref:Uncharacterized protein n=1 Tax=Rhizoclosmatium globosum TaxID=329046 RepID=A0A1Y2B0I0_9FUNG|nr:hypothetical protein BCR33DRAFT_725329 [Rhizoclosmatium globosum]|eukprot:ORY27987.1 hypothetical protein BCR33DRAFT_725329 [Rhizoclosmatium globosum]
MDSYLNRLFPSLTSLIPPHIISTLFPQDCPQQPPLPIPLSITGIPSEYHETILTSLGHPTTNDQLPITSPILLVLALVGLGVGIQGVLWIPRELWTLQRVFLWYAGMNAGAILCHCLAGSPEVWALGWAVDVGCTGSIGLNLVLAAFIHPRLDQRSGESVAWMDPVSLLVSGWALATAHWGITNRVSWTSELIYLAPLGVAAVALAWRVVIPVIRGSISFSWIGKVAGLASVISVGLGAAGVLLEPHVFCEWRKGSGSIIGSISFLDAFFTGCLVGLQALLVFVMFGGVGTKKREGGVGALAQEVVKGVEERKKRQERLVSK